MEKYLKLLMPAMLRYMRARYSAEETRRRWKKVMALDAKWIREEGDLGGNANMMSGNMMLCYAMCAFYEAVDRQFTAEDFNALFSEVMAKPLVIMGRVVDMNALQNNRAVLKLCYAAAEKYKKQVDKKRGGEWGNTWIININPHGYKTGLAFSLGSCPLYEFAQKYGYMDFLPSLCMTDHRIAAAMHSKLIRTARLSAGDTACDYWYVGDKSPEAQSAGETK